MSLSLFTLPPLAQRAWLAEALARPAPESARNLSDGFRLPGREGRDTAAAVLIPLVNRPQGLQLLLTKRSADLPDHPGQISFPGGRVEPDDASHAAAALREAREEVGIDVQLTGLVGVYSRPEERVVLIVFTATSTATPQTSEEAPEVRAFAPDALPWDDLAFWSTTQALRDALGR